MFAEIRPQGSVPARVWALGGFGLLVVAGFVIMLAGGSLAALAVALGMGAVLLFLVAPQVATLTAVFLLYSNLSVMASLHGVPTQVAGGMVTVLLAFPFFYSAIFKHERVTLTPVMPLMALYFASLLLSAALSAQPHLSNTRLYNYITEGLLLYFLTVNAIRNRQMLRRVLWVLLLAGSVMGGVTIYQGITQSYDNTFGGFAQMTEAQVAVAEGEDAPTVKIPSGPIGEKNRYAQILAVLLPIAITRLLVESKPLLKLAAVVAFALILGGALYTYSRGAGLGMGVMFLALLPLRLVKPHRLVILVAIGALLVIALAPGFLYRLSTLANVQSVLSGDPAEADSSLRNRAVENLATLRIFEDHPITGIGPGQTPSVIREYARGVGLRMLDPNRRAHNLYLEEMADTGLVGFIPFMSIVLVTLALLLRSMRAPGPDQLEKRYVMAGFVLSLIVYLTTAIFLHLAYERYYWFMLAVAGAAVEVYRSRGNVGEIARE